MANKDYGPHSPSVSEGGKRLTNIKFSSAPQPTLNLKNNPSGDVERKIRSMKFPQGGVWSSNIESALRSAK